MKNIFKFKNLGTTTIAVIVGVFIGIIIASFTNSWNFLEPIIGIATLAVAAGAWLEAKKSQNVMHKKTFEISFGLRKGYKEDAETSSIADVIELAKTWMQVRKNSDLPILTGYIDDKVLVYPVRKGQTDGKFHATAEPGCVFTGSLSPNYDKGRSDAEVRETLSDLARFLGTELGQERMYLSYCDKQFTIDLVS